MADEASPSSLRDAAVAAQETADKLLEQLTSRLIGDAADKLFPNGIDVIKIELATGKPEAPIFSLKFEVTGPEKPSALAGSAGDD